MNTEIAVGNQQREGKVLKVVPMTIMQLHRNAVYAAVQSFHQEINHYVATDNDVSLRSGYSFLLSKLTLGTAIL